MKLYSLLKNITCRVFGTTALDISGLYHNHTDVKENGLFFCLRGTRVDGKDFVLSAIKNGAVAIVTEQEIAGLSNTTQIIVKNARETMSLIACKFYGNPADKLKIIGVTGTNGKTTITNMIAFVLNNLNKKCAVVGTNGIYFGNSYYDVGMTTPDPIELQRYFSLMLKNKIEYVCMEVSAHAIDLNKVSGFQFEQVIFTNLTEDHLDYFKTMENYFLAKSKLFTRKHAKLAILNLDDEYGKRLENSITLSHFGYAINGNADIKATDIRLCGAGQKFKVGEDDVSLEFAGKFNVYNALASILSLEKLGFDKADILREFAKMPPVAGRFNSYLIDSKLIVIDYAHTPDGLENILKSCRELAQNTRLISVFGCGGNRDSQKREIMGNISSKLADFTFITSDNPRFEKRENIARDIEKGMINKNYKIVLDRSKAIEEAIKFSSAGDVIVIAGKGAENYIDENGVKIPYSDSAEIEKYRR